MKNKSIKYFLALVGFLFGFSSTVAAQYGAPPSKYKINGCVVSENNKSSLTNIKIDLKAKSGNYNIKTKSDNNGKFVFYLDKKRIGDTLLLSATDIDGDSNGSFIKKDTNIKFCQNDFELKKDDFIIGENKNNIVIFMKQEAIKPDDQKKIENK